MLALEEQGLSRFTAVHPAQAASARNLLHYLALRRRDLRPVQHRLARLGLSSLGRCEAAALTNLDAVLDVLERLQGGAPRPRGSGAATALELGDGSSRLERHAEDLLGPTRGDRGARIMVTLPPEAADDPGVVRGLIAAGMDCARINCAHDDEAAWGRMVHHLRAADGRYLPPYGHRHEVNDDWFEDYGADLRLGATQYAYVDGQFQGTNNASAGGGCAGSAADSTRTRLKPPAFDDAQTKRISPPANNNGADHVSRCLMPSTPFKMMYT